MTAPYPYMEGSVGVIEPPFVPEPNKWEDNGNRATLFWQRKGGNQETWVAMSDVAPENGTWRWEVRSSGYFLESGVENTKELAKGKAEEVLRSKFE